MVALSQNETTHPLGEDWTPKSKRIYGVPPIIKYEAFSSWVLRASITSKLYTSEFLSLLNIRTSSYFIDIGKEAVNIEEIAKITMSDINELTHLNWAFDSILSNDLFRCLSHHMEHNSPIIRFCPECLKADQIPYIRQSWRLATSYICPIHELILRETCHCCKNRLYLGKNKDEIFHFDETKVLLYCRFCSNSLGDSPSEKIDQKFLADVFYKQEELENLIRSTSSYWMPSELSNNHEILSSRNPRVMVWSVTNALIFLKLVINDLSDPTRRKENREKSFLQIQNSLHMGKNNLFAHGERIEGTYRGLSAQKLFSYLAPYIGLQISKYQAIDSGTVWYSNTVSGTEAQFERYN
jgi:hypothetical protein